MADNGGEKIEVKTLKTTDLDPSALTKAIEDSTKTTSKPAKVAKTEAKTAKKASAGHDDKEDSTRIIVKNRSAYMTSSTPATGANAAAVKAEPERKPPSATAKVLEAPVPSKSEESPSSAPTSDNAVSTGGLKDAPAEVVPTPPAQVEKSLSKQVEKLDSKQTDPTAQQALKVFDTTQYHLPIKPTAGQHYLNNTLAWTVLIIFLAGISAYMLNELEVIDLSQLGL